MVLHFLKNLISLLSQADGGLTVRKQKMFCGCTLKNRQIKPLVRKRRAGMSGPYYEETSEILLGGLLLMADGWILAFPP